MTKLQIVIITKVEFYIDNELVATDTDFPFSWTWDEKTAFKSEYDIKVIAYDDMGNTASDETMVRRVW